jgi:RimJ/RimL family protein N-acetyltransferase
MTAPDPARLLEWDSAFWGVTVGRVEGDALTEETSRGVDEWARDHSVDCLYLLARGDDPGTLAAAQEGGFRLVDVRLELERGVDVPEAAGRVRPHREDDVAALRAVARAAYEHTRFFADPRFPDERCRDFYETWVAESCAGWSDAVLVAERNGSVAGFVTCDRDEVARDAAIRLIGVAASEREKGVGAELVAGALEWAAASGADRLTVVTQGGNVAGQRLFQRCGFRTASTGLWLHKWYTPARA